MLFEYATKGEPLCLPILFLPFMILFWKAVLVPKTVIGVGAGLIFKTRSSSAGTDLLAAVLHKLTRRPLGMMQMTVDLIIVVLGFVAFPDWKTPFYSLITIFIMGKVIDIVIGGYSSDKTFFIISEKTEELRLS